MKIPKIRIGTRASKLALTQAGMIADRLRAAGADVCVVTMTTSGDRFKGSLAAAGGKGLFVKELEEALLAGTIDVAVHSLKDVPGQLPERLVLASFPERVDPRDAFICEKATSLDGLPKGARIGTSSPRRAAQVKELRPDLAIVPLRGNVETRIRKMRDGEVDATLLAAAGLKRLGMEEEIADFLDVDRIIPAVGQGCLALETRAGDRELIDFLYRTTNHRESELCCRAERAVLAAIGGDCRTPLAAYATLHGTELRLVAFLADEEYAHCVREALKGDIESAEELGHNLGMKLKEGLRIKD